MYLIPIAHNMLEICDKMWKSDHSTLIVWNTVAVCHCSKNQFVWAQSLNRGVAALLKWSDMWHQLVHIYMQTHDPYVINCLAAFAYQSLLLVKHPGCVMSINYYHHHLTTYNYILYGSDYTNGVQYSTILPLEAVNSETLLIFKHFVSPLLQ